MELSGLEHGIYGYLFYGQFGALSFADLLLDCVMFKSWMKAKNKLTIHVFLCGMVY